MTSQMNKTIFISCGQFTDAEKRLGKQIAEMVKEMTGLEPFFAEEVHDLNGLDTNILNALHNCVAFITVMHPRGDISRPNGSVLVRTSVWIEQEIAIATYIQRTENRALPIIAFKHKSVGREGIRDLLHLNPIEFTDESDVLAELSTRLETWRTLKPSGIEVLLTSKRHRTQDGHSIRLLEVTLVNETNSRIDTHEIELRIPSELMKHSNAKYLSEVASGSPAGMRCFRFDQADSGPVRPHDRLRLASFEYCTACAVREHGGVGAIVAGLRVSTRVWVNGNEYPVERTVKQLAMDEGN